MDPLKRVGFHFIVLLQIAVLTWMFADLLWRIDFSMLKGFLVVVFSLLAYPLSTGFWQAVTGLFTGMRGKAQNRKTPGSSLPGPRSIAVNIPVYNEDIGKVLARLRVMYQSLQACGHLDRFDFYLLSDSTSPDKWISEEYGWARLCRQLDAFDRVFYRRRRRNVHQKAGNLLDFCQSWGRRYKYMVVLDADSLMDGKTLVEMAERMEGEPRLGILQTVPLLTRAETRFALVHQFANRLYGPVFARGLAFWQGRKGNYWGHNAIIRVEPFIRYCALPDLPGKPPLGGKILSHDFVEAALMVKAGFEVRMDPDLGGSYEEGPVDVLESAARDRRWCQGNLQHAWLLFAEKIHWASKLHFINGIFAYLGSFLWMIFLGISIALTFEWEKSRLSVIAVEGTSPLGGLSIAEHALLLFGIIISLLLFPKLLCMVAALLKRDSRRAFGGAVNLAVMAAAEVLVSTLMAPVLMVYHSRFLMLTLRGKGIPWKPPARESGGGLAWRAAFQSLRLQTVAGLLVLLLSLQIHAELVFWLSPVWAGLCLAVPIAVWTSRCPKGGVWGTFGSASASSEIERALYRDLDTDWLGIRFFTDNWTGFQNAVVDPVFNAIHLSLLEEEEPVATTTPRLPGAAFFASHPGEMNPEQVTALLESAPYMRALHHRVWRVPEADLHPAWQSAIARYSLKPVFSP